MPHWIRSTRLALALSLAGCVAPRPGEEASTEPTEPTTPTAPPASGEVALTLSGFESDAGRALVSLYLGPDGFPGDPERAFRTAVLAIEGARASVVFEGVPAGTYALSAFHDADGDHALDTNLLGIPTEPWGVSNDARNLLGPPAFEDARLELAPSERAEVRIVVR